MELMSPPPPPLPSLLTGEQGTGSYQAAGSAWTWWDPNFQTPIWFPNYGLCPAFCLASEIGAQKCLWNQITVPPTALGCPFSACPGWTSAKPHVPSSQPSYHFRGSHRQSPLEEDCTWNTWNPVSLWAEQKMTQKGSVLPNESKQRGQSYRNLFSGSFS